MTSLLSLNFFESRVLLATFAEFAHFQLFFNLFGLVGEV